MGNDERSPRLQENRMGFPLPLQCVRVRVTVSPPLVQRTDFPASQGKQASLGAWLVSVRETQLAFAQLQQRSQIKKPISKPLQTPRHPISWEQELQPNYKPCIFILRTHCAGRRGERFFRLCTLKQIAQTQKPTGKPDAKQSYV